MCTIPANFKWSFSKLESYSQCGMMFKLTYIDKVSDGGNAFSDYGTWCHKLLEKWAKNQIPSFALAEEYEAHYDDEVTHSFPPFPAGMGQKYFDAGLAYFESFDGFGDEWEVVSSEERFELDIGGYPFVGVVDLVLRNKNTGSLWVIDHKSKSEASMKKELSVFRRQLYTYAMFVKQKFGKYPEKLSFNMFKEGTWIHEDFDVDECNKTVEWIVDTIESILFEADWLVSPSSFFCRFICGCFDMCPAREAVLNPPPKEKKPRKNKNDEST